MPGSEISDDVFHMTDHATMRFVAATRMAVCQWRGAKLSLGGDVLVLPRAGAL